MAGAAAADMDFSCPHGRLVGGIVAGGYSLELAIVPDSSRVCRYEVSVVWCGLLHSRSQIYNVYESFAVYIVNKICKFQPGV
jgi:hypothetical protein